MAFEPAFQGILGQTNFGIPGLTGPAPVLLELGTITHGLQMDLLIQAMKAVTKTDVLSAPRIAVLNGFKAEFSAGEDVPILKQNVVGTTVTIRVPGRAADESAGDERAEHAAADPASTLAVSAAARGA